jgi:hypothetical protein
MKWFDLFQSQRYSDAYSKGHTAPTFYYLFIYLFIIFSPEALHMEGVVIETSKADHLIENWEF